MQMSYVCYHNNSLIDLQDIDLVALWQLMDRSDEGEVSSGRDGVVQLAIRLLSAIVNSAGCERVFSDFGITHTKRRNHLSPQTVHKSAVVKKSIREKHAANAGLSSRNRKRKLGTLYPSSTSSSTCASSSALPPVEQPGADNAGNCEFDELSRALRADAASAEEVDDESPDSSQTSTAQGTQSRTRTCIPLADLFLFPVAVGPNLESPQAQAQVRAESAALAALKLYWHGGVKNLDDELVEYDLLSSSND